MKRYDPRLNRRVESPGTFRVAADFLRAHGSAADCIACVSVVTFLLGVATLVVAALP